MATDPVNDESREAALALLAARRAVLLERSALAAHDVLAPEGIAFSRVRDICASAFGALETGLRDPRSESAAALPLEREIARIVHRDVPFEAIIHALHAALGAMLAIVSDAGTAGGTLALAATRLTQRIGSAAASEVDAAHRAALRRRAALVDRIRAAAGTLAAAPLDLPETREEVARAAAHGLRCDWAMVAEPEADGRFVIAAVVGRPAGWVQRWSLRADEGLVKVAWDTDCSSVVATPDLIPYEGDDRPPSVLIVALRDATRRARALLVAGRDGGEPLAIDDLTVADAIADISGRTLETAAASTRAAALAGELANLRAATVTAVSGTKPAPSALSAAIAARLVSADVALVRLLDDAGMLLTRGVHADSAAVAAELAGTTGPPDEGIVASVLSGEEVAFDDVQSAPGSVLRAMASGSGFSALALPVTARRRVVGVLELVRGPRQPFTEAERGHARTVAAQMALVLAVSDAPRGAGAGSAGALEGIGAALAAGGDLDASSRLVARTAVMSAGATRATVYAMDGPDALVAVATHGVRPEERGDAAGAALAVDSLRRDEPVLTGGAAEVEALAGGGTSPVVLSLPLRARGEPAGVLQLGFESREVGVAAASSLSLAVFAERAGEALSRAAEVARVRARLATVTALCDAAAPPGPLSVVDLLAAALRLAGATSGGVYARSDDETLEAVSVLGVAEDATPLVRGIVEEGARRGDGGPIVRDDLASTHASPRPPGCRCRGRHRGAPARGRHTRRGPGAPLHGAGDGDRAPEAVARLTSPMRRGHRRRGAWTAHRRARARGRPRARRGGRLAAPARGLRRAVRRPGQRPGRRSHPRPGRGSRGLWGSRRRPARRPAAAPPGRRCTSRSRLARGAGPPRARLGPGDRRAARPPGAGRRDGAPGRRRGRRGPARAVPARRLVGRAGAARPARRGARRGGARLARPEPAVSTPRPPRSSAGSRRSSSQAARFTLSTVDPVAGSRDMGTLDRVKMHSLLRYSAPACPRRRPFAAAAGSAAPARAPPRRRPSPPRRPRRRRRRHRAATDPSPTASASAACPSAA